MVWKKAVASSFVKPVIALWFLSGWYVLARLRYFCFNSRSVTSYESPSTLNDLDRRSPSTECENRGGEGGEGGEGGTASGEGGGVERRGGDDGGGGGDEGTESSFRSL